MPWPESVFHVVVAPDKFKGSLSAGEVARIVAEGFREGFLAAFVAGCRDRGLEPEGLGIASTELPVADGGEGTVEAALRSAGFVPVTVEVPGPTGRTVEATFARDADHGSDVVLVEMAQASGLDRLPGGVPAPLSATTRGTGELVRAALDAGAREVVLAAGGSATTDGGAGILVALGARLLDAAGHDLPDGGAALLDLDRVDLSGLDPRARAVRWTLAADVDNPLLGERGAAAVFGPQKGASPADVALLDAALTRFADVLAATTGLDARDAPGAGAAGGVGFLALGFFGATRRPGIEVVLELAGWSERTKDASLVITGEGSFDEQSLGGKTPVGVAAAAARVPAPVVVLSGRRTLPEARWRAAGFSDARALTDLEPDPAVCVRDAAPLLARLARDLGAERGARAAAQRPPS
ncbi:glycerate kinase [Kineococcus rhizosphaerae]|uniref:Glycerate kinase n=1 Tax=Kineococcus rhizosphaerae TaxID=559628 RepID=A0A2T0R7G6_9ACTN|nr:glycerate kinase [Kineococcus rhizosphaerae]PRY17100.1 glycerate kinase [Kineococcus rhizosphaerae]